MRLWKGKQGFTLVEILLVAVIIGVILAVVVPRAWRANVDAKYGLVRQEGSELASYALKWAHQELQSQERDSAGMLNWYLASLCGWLSGTYVNVMEWVPSDEANWSGANIVVRGRNRTSFSPGEAELPSTGVVDIVPPEKIPRNPFNGASYFSAINNPAEQGHAIPGAFASGINRGPGGDQWVLLNYYALVFQGTDNSTYTPIASAANFHGGQGPSLEGLRNGVFIARTR